MNFYIRAKIISKKLLPEFLLNIIKKAHYERVLKKFNIENEPDLLIVKYLVDNNDYVIDIGANIGVYTKFLSDFVGKQGKVYSIEPIPTTVEFLENNIKKLNLSNVSVLNYAVSDKNIQLKMIIPSKVAGEDFFCAKVINTDSKINQKQFIVESRTLDSLFFNKIENLSFIKCDVEGHELYVLEGAKKILDKFKPSLLLEVDGDPLKKDTNAFKVFQLLESLNYKPWFLNNKNLCRWTEGSLSINYFFLLDEHINKLKQKGIIN